MVRRRWVHRDRRRVDHPARVRSDHVVIDIPIERFEELVGETLDSLPALLGRKLDNVVVVVSDEFRPDLFGLYEGIPLTRRSNYGSLAMPDRITIFRRTILDHAVDEAAAIEQLQRTVIHEVAHHFGISDGRLRQLGW
jgi:predicted Zn-dependent protease with MMP-like domain